MPNVYKDDTILVKLFATSDIVVKPNKDSTVEGMPDRSGKPGTKRSETQLGEDLQRIAGAEVD